VNNGRGIGVEQNAETFILPRHAGPACKGRGVTRLGRHCGTGRVGREWLVDVRRAPESILFRRCF
jgi:hypothetical protein